MIAKLPFDRKLVHDTAKVILADVLRNPCDIKYYWAGICHNLGEYSNYKLDGSTIVRHYVSSWSHFTGDYIFPILGDYMKVLDINDEAAKANYMWGKDSDYGKLRLDLLRHIIRKTR